MYNYIRELHRIFNAEPSSPKQRKQAEALETELKMHLGEACRMPLADWLDEYAAAAVRPSTLKGYRRDLEDFVIPVLGKKSVCKITTEDVQKLYQNVKEHGRVNAHPEC